MSDEKGSLVYIADDISIAIDIIRDRIIELEANAAFGDLVRGLPAGWTLEHDEEGWWVINEMGDPVCADTPEEAFELATRIVDAPEAALKSMEVPK